MAVEGLIKGSERIFEPFLPGTFEEYELFDDGRAKLLNSGRFHPAGEKPGFTPFVPYEGKISYL